MYSLQQALSIPLSKSIQFPARAEKNPEVYMNGGVQREYGFRHWQDSLSGRSLVVAGHQGVPAQSLPSRPLLLQGHSSLLSIELFPRGWIVSCHGRVKESNSNTQRLLEQKRD